MTQPHGGRAPRCRVRIDTEVLVRDPLLDVDRGVYLDADELPLSATSRARLRELQRRWTSADERYLAGDEYGEPVDDTFKADLQALELRVRRELAGTRWTLVRNQRCPGPATDARRGHRGAG